MKNYEGLSTESHQIEYFEMKICLLDWPELTTLKQAFENQEKYWRNEINDELTVLEKSGT